MVKLRFKYVVEDVDRHGNVRLYFRRKGQAKTRLPGMPGCDEFTAAYSAALASSQQENPARLQRAGKGSFGYLCRAYYVSATFKRLDPSTQAWRRRSLDAICLKHGDKPVAQMSAKHVRMLRDEKSDFPGAARNRLKALKALFRWAVEEEEALNDPTLGVRAISNPTDGHHTWTPEEVEAFKVRHPLGSLAQLAMALIIYTTGRREDAVRFGPQHIKNGRIQFRQAKNEHRKPIDIDIPIHPCLAEVIAATSTQHLTFLVTKYGRPFTPNGFGNKFKDWCRQADLPHCSAHGLRKATSTRLAEQGASAHEIMSVTGHQSLEEVERYTRAAQRSQLADNAMSKLKR